MLILKLLTAYHLKSQGCCDLVCGHKIGRGDFIFCLDSCSTGAVESKDNREIPGDLRDGQGLLSDTGLLLPSSSPTSPLSAQISVLDGFLWKALAFGKLFCCLNAGGGL